MQGRGSHPQQTKEGQEDPMMNQRWNRNRWLVMLFGFMLVIGLSALPTLAHPQEEHPEDPEAEHPEGKEHPTDAGSPPTIEEVARFLEAHVADTMADSDGWIMFHDEHAGKDRKLRLDKIHRERLAKTSEGTYFVCADFMSSQDEVFDLDFWVQRTDEGLKVTDSIIHKESGKPRYTWSEGEAGVWKRNPM